MHGRLLPETRIGALVSDIDLMQIEIYFGHLARIYANIAHRGFCYFTRRKWIFPCFRHFALKKARDTAKCPFTKIMGC